MKYLTLQLNAKLRPLDRGDIYEDPIDEILSQSDLGEVDGGGTMMQQNGEIENCDVELALYEDKEEVIAEILEIIEDIGVPKGSLLHGENIEISVGSLEGLALYLNGTDLADEVYADCDINFVISEMNHLLNGKGEMYSYWEGATETALYFYGTSYEEMRSATASFISEYPLCQKSRICQIA